jgi:hypothetical protein
LNCADCAHWSPPWNDRSESQGECKRRQSPVVVNKVVDGKMIEKMIYPVTRSGDWCKHWKGDKE